MADGPARILIVDDDETDGELTQRRLKSVDAEVEFHQGPEGAADKIKESDYAVVLLDLNMPGISGLEILDALKRAGYTSKVCLFSSMDEPALAQIARTAGVEHLSKSASKEELVAKVTALLG